MKNIITKIVVFSSILAFFSFASPVNVLTENEIKVIITTDFGEIKLKLYNETPKHRDNFIKLVNQGFYDSLLFHRVIQSFMIQGGDPESKYAKEGAMLGNGGTGYTIPAEFNPVLFHKKGALAAARLGDNINPMKESSACQFYIVQGAKFVDADLDVIEARRNQERKQKIFQEALEKPEYSGIKEKFMNYKRQGNPDSIQLYSQKVIEPILQKEVNKEGFFKYTPEQRKIYSTLGGTPRLDGGYTVFGEVIEGLEVIDKIAAVQVDGNSRPLQNIRMKMKVVKN